MDSPPSLPAPTTVAEARPVDASERVSLVDVLRGAALCGIFLGNAAIHFSGLDLLPRARVEALESSTVNAIAAWVLRLFVFEKAMSTFSFLFGLGFAIQLSRAEARGASVVPVYVRRLGVLLLIGFTHLFALWYGDVLTLYASTGLLLLLFRNVSDRKLVVWGLVLILLAPPVVMAALRFVPLLAGSSEVMQAAAREARAAIRDRTLEAFASGSYPAVVRANARFYLDFFLGPMFAAYALVTLGRFLLGFVAGRRRIFHDAGAHLPLFRRLLGWGLAAAVVGDAAFPGARALIRMELLPKGSEWVGVGLSALRDLGILGTAAVYISAISLLYQRPRWRRLLSVFAPAGQMALTNYLGQTVLGHLVYYGYGFGLVGKVGPAAILGITLGLYGVQVLVSHLWLARFRFGPVEWLWRSLTYGKRQPMRRMAAQPGEGAAAT